MYSTDKPIYSDLLSLYDAMLLYFICEADMQTVNFMFTARAEIQYIITYSLWIMTGSSDLLISSAGNSDAVNTILQSANMRNVITSLGVQTMKSLNEALSKNINYTFKNNTILLEALTHSSLRTRTKKTYERLEFLGDSILSMIVATMLFELFPNEEEGGLAKRRTALICGTTIADVAKEIKLGEFLLMSKTERDIGRQYNGNNLEDALEALIGAIFLDGGFEEVNSFVRRYWRQLAECMRHLDPPQDYRSALQEWVHKSKLPLPQYITRSRSGPKHSPEFTVSLFVKNYAEVIGRASTVKGAEQKAAKLMLEKVKGNQ